MSDMNIPRKILIVEDSMGIAKALQRALGLYREGVYRVVTCDSGETALKRMYESFFDLLISDLRLPGINGLELLEKTRLISPETRALLITAFGTPEVEEQARRLGAIYLPKPFRLEDLIRLVERALGEPTSAPSSPVHKVFEPPIERLHPSTLDLTTGEGFRRTAHLIILACDLDGTLAEDGQVSPQTWESLLVAKMRGLILILVTGRTLDNFINLYPWKELCEAIVAENGAVVYFPRWDSVILPFGQLDPAFLQQLESLGVPLERGMAIAATRVPHDEKILRLLREIRSGGTIEYNLEAVMVLPPGATKGSGLLVALQELGYSQHNVVACGNAQNDRSLFEVAELAVAVSNAQPDIKLVVDTVLSQPDGEGVQALTQDLVTGMSPKRRARAKSRLLLGYRMSGSPLHLDPFDLLESNIGIFGSSGSGKSWLAGLLAEELLKQKYQLTIIDPEGDYRSLGASPHTLLLGGTERLLPDVADMLNMCEGNNISQVLDLSMYTIEQKITYVAEFLHALSRLRYRRGRPHYLLVDEIQSFCPLSGDSLTDLFLEAMQLSGFSLVSYRLNQIAPELLAALDHFLITRLRRPDELKTLQTLLNLYQDRAAVLDELRGLPKGQAFLCFGSTRQGKQHDEKKIIKFRVGPRVFPHIRHLHKYLRAPLPEGKRFYFRAPGGGSLGRTAASLWEFREALGDVTPGSIRYHLDRGDFEQWLRDVLHDEELARRVHKIRDRNLKGEILRRAISEAVIDRYEELEALI